MDDLASAVVEQLRGGDGPAKHWLLCCVSWQRFGPCSYAAIVPEVKDGKNRYVVELSSRDLNMYAYKAQSKHPFATALDAANFFCAHAEGVSRERTENNNPCCALSFTVVSPEQTTKLFEEETPPLTNRNDILDEATLRASWRCPAQVAAMLEAVAKQV